MMNIEPEMKRCSDCMNCAVMDIDWNNWTVKDTVGTCYLGIHPEREWSIYFWDTRTPDHERSDHFATICDSYTPGGPGVSSDVDREDVIIMNEAMRAWYEENEGTYG